MTEKTSIGKIEAFSRFGMRLGLERMASLMDRLGNPQRKLKVIHVAGTNGKGSVCRFLYEALQANGYRTGIFTSPYIQRFHERIQFDGNCISQEDLDRCSGRVLAAAEEMTGAGEESPTEFEIVTAVAFLYFAEKNCDFAILEVGLGGRGDSTNLIENSLISVITSISFDHMDRLGYTLEEIAAEKAGIIKPRVPVVCNVEDTGAAKVVARAAYESGCRLYDVTKLNYGIRQESIFGYEADYNIYGTDYSGVKISMSGRHQLENLKTALAVIEILRKAEIIRVERSRLYAGLEKARQPGRMEVLERTEGTKAPEAMDGAAASPLNRRERQAKNPAANPAEESQKTNQTQTDQRQGSGAEVDRNPEPLLILDGAHNRAGAEALKETIAHFLGGRDIVMIVGMLRDKEIREILDAFTQITDKFIAVEPDNPRKLPAAELQKELQERGAGCLAAENIPAALAMAKEQNPEVILAAGSLYMIGELRGNVTNE